METSRSVLFGVTCSALKPTRSHKKGANNHRPAVWDCVLGTVYALNDDGECKYFDYDLKGALEFAGVAPDRDPRAYRLGHDRAYRYVTKGATEGNPRVGNMVLWIRDRRVDATVNV